MLVETVCAVYTVSLETPPGFTIQVTPEKLQFTKYGEKLTYQVIVFSALLHLSKMYLELLLGKMPSTRSEAHCNS